MKINSIEITSFGKLKNYALRLEDGFQVLLGNNEDGKTTVMTFLKMMFYRSTTRARTLSGNPRKKYAPWDGDPMQGAVEFESEGTAYRLQKTIGDIPSKDKVELLNLNTGKPVDIGRDEEIGQRFFSLDLQGFERSCFIGDTGEIDGINNDSLTNRLIENLIQSGDETTSQSDALDRLQKAAERLVSKNKKRGLLVEEQTRLDDLEQEQSLSRYQLEQQQTDRARFDELSRKLEAAKGKDRRRRLEQLRRLLSLGETVEEEKTSLERPDVTTEHLPELIEETGRLSEAYTQAKSALDNVQSAEVADAAASEAPLISKEEWAQAEQLYQEFAHASQSLDSLERKLRPLAEDYREKLSSYHGLAAEVEGVRHQLDTQYPGWSQRGFDGTEQRRYSDKLETLRDEMEQKRSSWKPQIQRARQQTETTKRQLEILQAMEQVKSPPVLLIIAGILAVAAIALALLSRNPAVLAGLVLPIGLAAFHLLKKRPAVDAEQRKQASDRYIAASQAEESLLQKIDAQEREYDQAVSALKDKIASLSAAGEDASPALRLMERYEHLSSEARAADARVQAALEAYQRQAREFLAEDLSFQRGDLPDEPDIPRLTETAEVIRARLSVQSADLQRMLAQKGCHSLEEYQEQYLASQSNAKNNELAIELRKKEQRAGALLCESISRYEPVSEPVQALALFSGLKRQYERLQALRAEHAALARGMGVAGQSAQELRNELEQLASLLRDAPDGAEAQESLSAEELDALDKQLRELSASIRMPERPLEQIEMEIRESRERIQEMTQYHQALLAAKQVMEAAAEELQGSFGPELRKKTGELLSAMTDVYGSVLIDNKYEVKVRTGDHFREHSFFSSGTVDQVYLALRIAISQLIAPTNERIPLFLDDVLMQYDNDRLARALQLLQELGRDERTQILLFTCHGHIAETASVMGISASPLIR